MTDFFGSYELRLRRCGVVGIGGRLIGMSGLSFSADIHGLMFRLLGRQGGTLHVAIVRGSSTIRFGSFFLTKLFQQSLLSIDFEPQLLFALG